MEEKQKMLVMLGTDDKEVARTPFRVALGAAINDVEVAFFFNANGVRLLYKDDWKRPKVDGLPKPIPEMIRELQELGGVIYACSPCMMERAMTPEDLLDDITPTGASTLVEEGLASDCVFTF